MRGRRDAEAKDKKALRRSHFMRFFRQVICPTGNRREFVSSPSAKKYFAFSETRISRSLRTVPPQ
jgi:hypothetical protein